MKLYIITLEPIEKRYTKQWHTYWKKEFGKYFNTVNIDGTIITDKIDKGRFLDINKTNIWKSEQVIKLAELFKKGKIKSGDKFIFMDAWHPGVINLKYMADLQDIKIKIYGYWHAGSYDKWDFLSQADMGYWAHYFERSLFTIFDRSFVATQYHKQIIIDNFGKSVGRYVKVVHFPMRWDWEIKKRIGTKKFKKENIVVFPHRLDREKQPSRFDRLEEMFKTTDIKFIKTMEVTKDKKEYYELLAKAKIVFSANLQETFGIGTVEAMCLGCVPILPDRLTYPEMYKGEFLYKDLTNAALLIGNFINDYDKAYVRKLITSNANKIKNQSFNSIKMMARVMQE